MERSPNLAADNATCRVVVVIPAYRVAPYIRTVLEQIPPFVDHIVVVDDDSTDDLQQVLTGIKDPRLHVVRHDVNAGVGAAMITGNDVACRLGCDIIVKVDGDGQMDPARILDLMEPVISGRADYAKGNRFLHRSEIVDMPLVRRYGNIVLTFLAKSASGCWKMFDPSNGFTAIHARAWRALDTRRLGRRYFFETSMLIELGSVRAVVEDVAIPAVYQGEVSSLSPIKLALEFPPRLAAGILRRLGKWYFLYDFTPVSLFLTSGVLSVVFALSWGSYHWWKAFNTGTPTTTGTVMLSVVTLILGVQLLLQAVALDIQNAPCEPIQRRSEPTQTAGDAPDDFGDEVDGRTRRASEGPRQGGPTRSC